MPEILSMIPKVVWPAIPNARASQLLAVQFQLELSQWSTPAELLKGQIRQLAVLLQHAYEHVPYYRQRFDELRLTPDKVCSVEKWREVPLLSRRDIQTAGSRLYATGDLQAHGPISTTMTSGSTGQPVVTKGTTVTRLFVTAIQLRQHLWHRRNFGLKLATIRMIRAEAEDAPKEVSADTWGRSIAGIIQSGPAVALDVHASVEEQAEFLLREDPDYLNTYPTVVLALAEHFERTGKKLTRLCEVRTFGEVLDPEVRVACQRVWGVKVVDTYSSQEFGDIAGQCPEQEHYHVHSENVLVEVLDEQGQACKPGQIGKLVVTALHNFASPLIRYDIGDFAEVGPPCPCGRGLPVLKRIVGRQRNMFHLPDGRVIWPSLNTTAAEEASLPPIQQFQLIQRTLHSVELLIVAPRVLTDPEVQTVRDWVDRSLNCRLDLKITYVAEIARGKTGKYEDFRCEVNRDPVAPAVQHS